ncbi:TonB family protein [Sphingomonas lutea]|uniref:TonB family protein n=2 Tax=Sphingomonas lutea TaxID=1045317 RepID=A0A7G9SH50_9SPHN|nr:TonB family protein [Sphingomonas lutea]QNN67175.1 TonB family protein [Sphingomonas lutea]
MLILFSAVAMAAQAPAAVVDEPIWQMPSGEIMFRDYPVQAMGKTGNVAFRMTTSAEGDPQACEVTRGSGNAVLDREACRSLMMYAKFKPIKVKNGIQVVKGLVRWSPSEAAAALAAMRNPRQVVAASAPQPRKLPTPRWGWKRQPKLDRNLANEKVVCKRVPRAGTLSGSEYRCRAPEAWARSEESDGFWGELQGRKGAGTNAVR